MEKINISIKFNNIGVFNRSYIENIKNGGLFLKIENPLPIDTELIMHIAIPTETDEFVIDGVVVWNNTKSKSFPVGMGIQFVNIDDKYKYKIRKIVKNNISEIRKNAII